MTTNERIELAQWAAEYAKKCGATESSVKITNQRKVDIEYRNDALENLNEATQNSLSIEIYQGHKYSGHNTNDLKKDTLKVFIKEAVAATKYLAEDEYRYLPDPKFYPENLETDLELMDQDYYNVKTEDRIDFAERIVKAARSESDKLISATGSFSDNHYNTVIVNSNGFTGTSEGSSFSTGGEVTAKDKDARPEDYYYVRTRFRADLPNAKTIGKRAAQKALDKIGQDKIESGDYTMIVENSAMSRLIWMLIAPMHARSIQQKQSYLEGMLNKKIASEKLTITDNPFIKKGLGSRLFDNDGIAAQTRVMIENGVLKNYYVDPYYGRKLKMDPTTNGSSNLEFNSGNQSLNQMINSVNKGIFVTGFIGGNSNQTTGDFSFGISGRLIEKGKLSIPVNEMNISGNSKEFWNKLTVIGNDPYPYSSILRPSMLFEDIAFSGL